MNLKAGKIFKSGKDPGITVNKIISTVFGIGYIKGGGTVASVVCCLFIWFSSSYHLTVHPVPAVLLMLFILLTGIYTGNKVEKYWGKDSYRVVIDEVAGMWLTMLFIPPTWYYLLTGLVLFRFFDIVKPLYIRKMEDLPGGTGVMMDDMLAGVYANILMHLVILIF